MSGPIEKLADACCTQALSAAVPADDEAFRRRKSFLRRAVRSLRKELLLSATGQRQWLRSTLDPAWKRLLWIHEGMPQIGDALMDLAPRSLLIERGLTCDLFAAPHIAALFDRDQWFRKVLSRPEQILAEDYDAAIVLSHEHKALRFKRERLPRLPWVSIQGLYGGPDFHRARFSAQRLADLSQVHLDAEALNRHATQKLSIDPASMAQARALLPAKRQVITLCVGGVWSDRTWHHWAELLALLRQRQESSHFHVLLLGGSNGEEEAQALTTHWPKDHLTNLVGQTSLRQAHALLACSHVVVCADGGLMHIALTTEANVVALFPGRISAEWRLPDRQALIALQARGDAPVDAVQAEDVALAVMTWSSRVHELL